MNAEHPTAVPLFAVTAVAVIVDSVVASVTAVSMAAPHVLSRLLPGTMLCLACATLNAQEAQEYEYIPRGGATLEPGEAPGATVVPHGAVVRVSEVRLRGGDELIAGLLQYAEAEQPVFGYLNGVGGFESMVFAWYDPERGAFRRIPVDAKSEVVSLTGNVSYQDGKADVHVHAVVALGDGTTRGGHLVSARISPIMQIYVTETEQ